MGGKETLVPVLGGIAGGAAAVLATQKWNAHPGLIAAGTAAAGLAAMSMSKQPWLRQAGAGAVVGAAVVGAVPLVVGALDRKKVEPPPKHRAAEGDGFVTRTELQDALSKLAETQKEQQQKTCDLLNALDEIKQIVAASVKPKDQPKPAGPSNPVPYLYTFSRDAAPEVDEYAASAYGYGLERNAQGGEATDEYHASAYGDAAERNAGEYDAMDLPVAEAA